MNTHSSAPKKVLIIGSGIGGLSTAIILAKLGVDVTVLEKNRHPGGLMRSYSRDGIECDVGVHYLGSLDKGQVLRRFFDYLGVTTAIPVTRMGRNGVIDRYIFDGGTSHQTTFDLPEGIDSLAAKLNGMFPDERELIGSIIDHTRRAATQLHGLDILYSTENDLSLLDQSSSMGEILDKLRCSPRLRSILAIPSCWIGVALNDCPAYYHNMALASYISSSWRLEKNGSHMADVFARRLVELGGRIMTGKEVKQINVASRVVKGITLGSGENIQASTVIGAIHPKVVLNMLSPGDVKPSYRKRISGLKDTHGIFSTHVAIDGACHPALPYNVFNIETDQQGNVPNMYYYQIRNSAKKDLNLLSILSSGQDELWSPWKHTQSGNRGREYMELKKRHANELVRGAEQVLGAFKDTKILDTYTPLTMRDWVNSPAGSAYGVQRSTDQLLATAMLNRTAVKGLYLSGQNVVAPGIIGTIMGSFSTVKLLLGTDRFNKTVCL